MELYLVRHGQSKANAAHIMQGAKINRPLTEQGRAQALVAKDKLADMSFDQIYVSPLKRASETAELIVGSRSTITIDPRLVEFDYGKWDGQSIEKLVNDYPEYFKDASNFGNSWQVSGGEKYSETYQRLLSFMNDLDLDASDNVLVVSHGMTIKLWVGLLLEIEHPERIAEPANASFTHFSFYHRIPILKAYSRWKIRPLKVDFYYGIEITDQRHNLLIKQLALITPII